MAPAPTGARNRRQSRRRCGKRHRTNSPSHRYIFCLRPNSSPLSLLARTPSLCRNLSAVSIDFETLTDEFMVKNESDFPFAFVINRCLKPTKLDFCCSLVQTDAPVFVLAEAQHYIGLRVLTNLNRKSVAFGFNLTVLPLFPSEGQINAVQIVPSAKLR